MTKNRFILTFGVLGWGVLGGCLFAWWMASSRGTSFWLWLAISLPIWCLGGYVFGLALWRGLRRRDLVASSQRGTASHEAHVAHWPPLVR